MKITKSELELPRMNLAIIALPMVCHVLSSGRFRASFPVKGLQLADLDVTDLVIVRAEDSSLRGRCSVGKRHAYFFGWISKPVGSGFLG